jgi:hypothetical protein
MTKWTVKSSAGVKQSHHPNQAPKRNGSNAKSWFLGGVWCWINIRCKGLCLSTQWGLIGLLFATHVWCVHGKQIPDVTVKKSFIKETVNKTTVYCYPKSPCSRPWCKLRYHLIRKVLWLESLRAWHVAGEERPLFHDLDLRWFKIDPSKYGFWRQLSTKHELFSGSMLVGPIWKFGTWSIFC